jgi:LuxR family maltose regulon positive regulatory protein
MSPPILTIKLSIPPKRPGWVLKQLDQGLQRRLTLISAPAGFGKTTLSASGFHGLSQNLQTAPRGAWLSLEEDDNDPTRFLPHFIAAFQLIDPGAGESALAYLKTPLVPKLTHLMTLLINDLAGLSAVRIRSSSCLIISPPEIVLSRMTCA